MKPRIELEMTLLMWRNHFTCDVLAEKRLGAYFIAVQMGTDDIHAPDTDAAERPTTGRCQDADSGRSDLGGGVRALQEFVRTWRKNGLVGRSLAAPGPLPARRRSGQQGSEQMQ